MPRPKTDKTRFTVEDLWRIERLGDPSLSPDGAQAVAALTRYSMDDNKSAAALWLLSALGGEPRQLTTAGDKDGRPAWSPRGDLIAFTAKREQQGAKDDEQQLYVIAPDGGEARRAVDVATGVDAFKWLPDGGRIAFVSWVRPGLKGTAAQAKAHKAFKGRKETGYATSEAQYRFWDHNLPMERVPHLHLLELAPEGDPDAKPRVRDLFEGTDYELARTDPDANAFDVSPDGKRIVFAFDPAKEKRPDGRYALAEIELKSGKVRVVARDADWDFGAPRYSPDGERIAFIASHQGRKHTMPQQLAVCDRKAGSWRVLSAHWDREVAAPLRWADDGRTIVFAGEEHGRRHLWRFDVDAATLQPPALLVRGGSVAAFDIGAGRLVTLSDSAVHPARIHVRDLDAAGAAGEPRRIGRFNDELLAGFEFGRVEETWVTGALGDRVQVWIVYPPGFDGKTKTPLMHNIHGGPHTAPGDNWHYRWNTQVFAAQGYVVASVNYHGSSSFGHAFLDSITHRWGELELQDIEAATTALLKQPWADRRRVFATGGSYGGFMVAWMNGHLPKGRYAAYVCHAGCFDWVGMFADDAWSWHAKELGAWYWDDIAKVHAQSPHAFAKHFTTPTLVIHGALDYRVPDAQGLAYYNTLKALGIDARLVWYPDENHWILKPRNSRLWYAEFFGWLARHDPGAKAGRKARAA